MKHSFGRYGKVLQVNLGSRSFSEIQTNDHAPRFIGGRGIASRLYWEKVSAATGAFDPDNHLYFMAGPLGGTKAQAASRWIVLGKSPLAVPEQYAFGNLGGRFGAALKWSGLDGLDITGASSRPVFLVVEADGSCRIEDASHLWGKDTFETIASLRTAFGEKSSVATIGKSGERRVRFASIIGSGGVAATKGFGAVMGSKKLKAVVVKASRGVIPAARPEELKKITRDITALWKGQSSERYWINVMLEEVEKVENAFCFGCPGVCGRGTYQDTKGNTGYLKNCISAYYYSFAELNRTGKIAETSFFATRLANRLGLCTNELRFLVVWVPAALRRGVIDPDESGLKAEEVGSPEWIEKLTGLIVNRQGIGDLLAEGSRRAVQELGCEDLLNGMVTKTGFDADLYNPRLFLPTAPIYATEPIHPITQLHAVSFPMVKWMVWMGSEGTMGKLSTRNLRLLAGRFWGDEKAAEFDTPEKTGKAAVIMQNRAYAKENFILCDFFWPIDYSGNSQTAVGDPSLEAKLFSAVTGQDMDEDGFLRAGERCANLCRAIFLREGRRGRPDDVLEDFNYTEPLKEQAPPVGLFNPDLMLPGKNGELFSSKGSVVKKEVFETVMDDYYKARAWDTATGLFTRQGLASMDLDDLIPELAQNNLLGEN